jgi:hypothetical protein
VAETDALTGRAVGRPNFCGSEIHKLSFQLGLVYAPISAGLTFNVIRESGPGQERFNHEIAKGEAPVAHAGGINS